MHKEVETQMAFEDDDEGIYLVLVNDEEQRSIWPERRPVPDGWRSTSFRGSKAECVGHVDETWSDLRPLSLRQEMEAR